MSASLAIAVLALIAILPEYAIEAVLAWDAGSSFDTATGGYRRDITGSRERHRVEPPVDRSGLVGSHPHLLAETQAGARHAWRIGLGDSHARDPQPPRRC